MVEFRLHFVTSTDIAGFSPKMWIGFAASSSRIGKLSRPTDDALG